LLDDEAADGQLRGLLRAGAEDVAPPAVLERSARKLGAALGVQLLNVSDKLGPAHVGAPHGASTSASASGGAPAMVGGKLLTATAVKGALALALVGSASWMAVNQRKPATSVHQDARSATPTLKRPLPVSAEQSVPVLPAPAPAGHEDAITSVSAAASVAGKTQGAPVPAARARTTPHLARTVPAPTRLATPGVEAEPGSAAVDPGAHAAELRSLEDARRALAADPGLALQRLQAHAREFPNGWLDEERAALEVQALILLRDHAAAERALEQLATRHPRSLAITRLRNALENRSEH
jgi:hypothetical protein